MIFTTKFLSNIRRSIISIGWKCLCSTNRSPQQKCMCACNSTYFSRISRCTKYRNSWIKASWIINQTSNWIFGWVTVIDQFAWIFGICFRLFGVQYPLQWNSDRWHSFHMFTWVRYEELVEKFAFRFNCYFVHILRIASHEHRYMVFHSLNALIKFMLSWNIMCLHQRDVSLFIREAKPYTILLANLSFFDNLHDDNQLGFQINGMWVQTKPISWWNSTTQIGVLWFASNFNTKCQLCTYFHR